MSAVTGIVKILFFIGLAIFLLELFRNSSGVGQVLNDFWDGLDKGYKLEAGAGGGKYKTGASSKVA
jgi:hypothetical protein